MENGDEEYDYVDMTRPVDEQQSSANTNNLIVLDDDSVGNDDNDDDEVMILDAKINNNRRSESSSTSSPTSRPSPGRRPRLISRNRQPPRRANRNQEDLDREIAMRLEMQNQLDFVPFLHHHLHHHFFHPDDLFLSSGSSSSGRRGRGRGRSTRYHPHLDLLFEHRPRTFIRAGPGGHHTHASRQQEPFTYEQMLELQERLGTVKVGLSPEEIERLPTYPFTASSHSTDNQNNDGKTCPICLTDFEQGEMIMILNPCLHLFHESCSEKWLKENKKCPVCRETIVAA